MRPLAWKDTVNIPMKIDGAVAGRRSTSGRATWMFHCHILDHAEGGLMGTVQVGGAAGTHTHPPPKKPRAVPASR